MFKIYCRAYQSAMKLAESKLKWREPQIIEGNVSILRLPKLIKKFV